MTYHVGSVPLKTICCLVNIFHSSDNKVRWSEGKTWDAAWRRDPVWINENEWNWLAMLGGDWGAILLLWFSRAERQFQGFVCLTASEELMNGLFNKTSLMSKSEPHECERTKSPPTQTTVHACHSNDLGWCRPNLWTWTTWKKEIHRANLPSVNGADCT